jgi:hypothetical protein
MHPETAKERLIDRALWHWEERRKAAAAQTGTEPPVPGLTICVEREAGTQGSVIAHEVGKLLGWPVYDRELLEKIAQEMHLQTRLLESVDERHESWLEEAAESFAQVPLVGESVYVRHLVRTVLALGTHGQCVIVGRGAAFILPTATTLPVYLVGGERERVAVAAKKLNMSEPEAARKVRGLDRQRRVFVRDHFLRDTRDPHNYDLVLNTSHYSTTDCAELIVQAAQRRLEHRAEGRPGTDHS